MFITKIVIDGFKSYATRTEITDFDRSFNAITGLNGSGKSNILDSICFVLGITNLSHVRANNLQELIYKNGQAGIEKATVSIVFDNSDKSQSPVGYDGCREITITRQVYKQQGKNRYLINGTVVPANKVKDLFGSVSLNVNNPHFLIMQGRVTKVLNMKPPEILAMLEEATGTRMYEDKKRETQRVLEKKDQKLQQINEVLQEDLQPQMDKLVEERQAFARYSTICRQLDQLHKVHIAWKFLCTEESEKQLTEEVEKLLNSIDENITKLQEIKEHLIKAKEDVKALERQRDEESGEKLKFLEEDLKKCELDHAKVESNIKHVKEQIRGEQKSRKEAEKYVREAESQIAQKKADIDKINGSAGSLLEQKQLAEQELELAKKNLEALAMGMTTNEKGVTATLTEQLRQAEVESATSADQIQQAVNAITHVEPALKLKSKELAQTENLFRKDNAEIENREKGVKSLEDRIGALHHDTRRMEELEREKNSIAPKLRQLKADVDTFDARNQNLVFNYVDPCRGFDRSKVLGMVCNLFDLKDPRWARAIEATAGARLYQVIVDTDETARQLIKNGRLQRRITIIPLNKISGSSVEPHRLRNAQNLIGKDNVFQAIDLVSFDSHLTETMKYVFGRTLVATSLDGAERLAYDGSVGIRTVSVCGSVCDPSGMLSGGSTPAGPSTLERLDERRRNGRQLEEIEARYQQINQELRSVEAVSEQFNKLNQELMVRRAEWEQCKARLANTTHAQLRVEIEEIKAQLAEHRKRVEEMKERKSQAESKIRELKERMRNAKGQQEKEIKEAKTKIERCTKAVTNAAEKCGKDELRLKELRGDIELLEKEVEEANQKSSVCDAALSELSEQLRGFEEMLEERTNAKKAAVSKLKEQKDCIKHQSTEIGAHYKSMEQKQKLSDELKLSNQQTEHDVKKKRKEAADAAEAVKALLSEFPWIRKDREHFGKPNSDYDFERNDPREVMKKVKELSAQKEKLAKTVNARAHTQASQIETQYKDLMKKRAQVLKDKANIVQAMHELDVKKEETIKKAYTRVNSDFGDIFNSLLAGASAKLQPPDGKKLLDGLEVKVSFGGVWKESLTELSGGQRSLVALSLILAMLLFKPAPIYILDEVDAALDLSHTQNIGLMIKNHFRTSQFIIVSLKDGLFSNANVLFKTKFVDGRSTVERFASKRD